MQRDDLERGRSFLQLNKHRLALVVEFRRAGADHIWITDALGEMIDQPVDLAMALLAPNGAGADHLKALARVARLLRTDSRADSLRATDDPARLYALLTAPIASQHAA